MRIFQHLISVFMISFSTFAYAQDGDKKKPVTIVVFNPVVNTNDIQDTPNEIRFVCQLLGYSGTGTATEFTFRYPDKKKLVAKMTCDQ